MKPKLELEYSAAYSISSFLCFFSFFFIIPSFLLLLFVPIVREFNMVWHFFIWSTVVMLICKAISKHEEKKHQLLKQSIENDQFVYGEIIDLIKEEEIEIDYCHPFVLKVQCQNAQGEIFILDSKYITMDLSPSVVGQYIRVYYVDDRFKNHYMCLDTFYMESHINAS